MKIYFGHSKSFDYKKELYEPIRNSSLNQGHEIIFPHEDDNVFIHFKEIIKNCDLMVAEVSYPATGLGIELGWVECFGKKVICVYRQGVKVSGSLKVVTDKVLAYKDCDGLIKALSKELSI